MLPRHRPSSTGRPLKGLLFKKEASSQGGDWACLGKLIVVLDGTTFCPSSGFRIEALLRKRA